MKYFEIISKNFKRFINNFENPSKIENQKLNSKFSISKKLFEFREKIKLILYIIKKLFIINKI